MGYLAAPKTEPRAVDVYVATLHTLGRTVSFNQTAEDRADQQTIEGLLLTMIRRNGYTADYKPGTGFMISPNKTDGQ